MLVITNMHNHTCYHTSIIIFPTTSQTNISWLLRLQHQQLFLKLLDTSTRLFRICRFYVCLFRIYLFIFTHCTHSIMLILMQFQLFDQISSSMSFFDVKFMCYYIKLSYQNTACHMYIPVYNVCLVHGFGKTNNIANL